MADLGDIGHSAPAPRTLGAAGNFRSFRPRGGSVVAIPSTQRVLLSYRGVAVEVSQGAVDARFYDLDSGTYHAVEVGGAQAWQVDIAGLSVTVTPLGGGVAPPATHAYASVML